MWGDLKVVNKILNFKNQIWKIWAKRKIYGGGGPDDSEDRKKDLKDGPAEEEGVVPAVYVRKGLVEGVVEDEAQAAPPDEPHGGKHGVAEDYCVDVAVGADVHPD